MSADTLWYKDAVFNELHVKACQHSSGDGMDDFEGLIQRLDYLCGPGTALPARIHMSTRDGTESSAVV